MNDKDQLHLIESSTSETEKDLMDKKNDELVISTLTMEYNAIREEIRDLINSMDTNFHTCIAMLGGLVALAGFTKDIRLLYLIPSLLFISVCIHLMKAA